MRSHRLLLTVLFAAALMATAPLVFAETHTPVGVPNISDPDVAAQFIPLSIFRFGENPDFPAPLLANVGQGSPQQLVIVDARNGKETWSPREDAPVFYLLHDDSTAIRQAFLDEGFAAGGKPSGRFLAAGTETAQEVLVRLLDDHRRASALVRAG